MTFSLFFVILTIVVLALAFMRYKSFIDNLHFNNELRKDKQLLEMYDDYLEFKSKYPDFEKRIKFIKKYMETK